MKKVTRKDFVCFVIQCCLVFILTRATLFHKINPFGISIIFVFLYHNLNPILSVISYVLSSIILSFSLNYLIICLSEMSIFLGLYFIQRFFRKKIKKFVYVLILVVSQSARLYFSSVYLESFLSAICSVCITLFSFIIFNISINALINRGKSLLFTLDEKICLAFTIIAIFSGVSGIYLENILITNILSIAVVFFVSRITSPGMTVCFSCFAGLGVSLYSSNIVPLALFSVWSSMAIAFSNNKKIVAALMVLSADIVVGTMLNTYAIYDFWTLLSSVFGLLIVCLIKEKYLNKFGLLFSKRKDIAKDYAILSNERFLSSRLKDISNVFLEMENVYKSLLLGEISHDKAIEFLSSECINKTCRNCEKLKHCYNSKIDMKSAFDSLSHTAIKKEKLTFLDLPNLITAECNRSNMVISNMNLGLKNLNDNITEKQTNNKNLTQLTSQFSATANMLNSITNKFNAKLNIDYIKSNDILEELLYNNILVNDVICKVNENGIDSIIMSVKTKDVVSPLILKAVEKITKVKYQISHRAMSDFYGFDIIVLKPANKYSISFGIATSSKIVNKESGDCYTILKLPEGKHLCAICDGMGSGKGANKIATATISLIENFYKAGFDSSVVIESVNNIILPTDDETFSTLDSVIIDLCSGRVDFIKIGATVSVIKKLNKSKIINCESLPMGIISDIKPTATTDFIEGGDILILASDGVVDSFSGVDNFLHFVHNERITNPQLLAENILEESRARTSQNFDDMTVLAIKISNYV